MSINYFRSFLISFMMIASIFAHGDNVKLTFQFGKNKSVETIEADQRVFEQIKIIDNMVNDLGGYGLQETLPLQLANRDSFIAIIAILKSAITKLDQNPDRELKVIVKELMEANWSNQPLGFLLEILKTLDPIHAPIIEDALIPIMVTSINFNEIEMPPVIFAELIDFIYSKPIKLMTTAVIRFGFRKGFIADASFFNVNSKFKEALIEETSLPVFLHLMLINEINYPTRKNDLEILYQIGLKHFFPLAKCPEGSSARDAFNLKCDDKNPSPQMRLSAQPIATNHFLFLQELMAKKKLKPYQKEVGIRVASEHRLAKTIELLNAKPTSAPKQSCFW